jgi:spore coat polysaccharide biosynthesis predicted glycosyltransferase SpsG
MRKNLLPNDDGTPLFLVSARAARDAGCTVVVSTDDQEIFDLAILDGHVAMWRPAELVDCPVDRVVEDVASRTFQCGPVLLVQPTVQPMTATVLQNFLGLMHQSRSALGTHDRHLIWHDGQVLTDRLQRQEEAAWPVRELGVRWWPGNSIPLEAPTRTIISTQHLTDIDTAQDYQATARPLSIQFQVDAYKEIGWGHLHRVLTLAEGLQHHQVAIQLMDSDQEAADFLESRGWPTETRPWNTLPDVTVIDRLDSREPLAWGTATVTLETTLHDGTATINALYGHGDYTGAKYAVLRPEFTIKKHRAYEGSKRIMVMFGGTDPAGLTRKACESLLPSKDLTVVVPGQSVNVAAMMHDHDLLITSGGRTVFEAAAVGIPTIVLCQNMRELTHTHLGVGNINLGLGRLVTPDHLRYTVEQVLGDAKLLEQMSVEAQASIDHQGAARVRAIIEHVARFGEKP